MSGAGARLSGGRWNPKDLFETLYLATPAGACVAELNRLATSQDVSVADLLSVPRMLHTIEVIDLPILDLSTASALTAAGLSEADIAADIGAGAKRSDTLPGFLSSPVCVLLRRQVEEK